MKWLDRNLRYSQINEWPNFCQSLSMVKKVSITHGGVERKKDREREREGERQILLFQITTSLTGTFMLFLLSHHMFNEVSHYNRWCYVFATARVNLWSWRYWFKMIVISWTGIYKLFIWFAPKDSANINLYSCAGSFHR